MTFTVTVMDSCMTQIIPTRMEAMGEKRLLTAQDIRQEYGIGRETAYGLLRVLPKVRVGTKYLVRREDLEAFLQTAAQKGMDIRALMREAPHRGVRG